MLNQRDWRAIHRIVLLTAICLLAAAALDYTPSPIREIGRFVLMLATLGIIVATFTLWTWPRRYATVLAIVIAVSWTAIGCEQRAQQERRSTIVNALQNLDAAERQLDLQRNEDAMEYLSSAGKSILSLQKSGAIPETTCAEIYTQISRLKSDLAQRKDAEYLKNEMNILKKDVRQLMNRSSNLTWKGGGSTS